MPGTATSPVEVVQLTPHGIWIAFHDEEYFLDHDLVPWLKEAAVKDAFNLQEASPGHLHWPDVDVDLDLERTQHPERFPLVAKTRD